MPLVTVVLIFLDGERFMAEAVQSVLGQTIADWELILVDDGSTDGSSAIARSFAAADQRIRYVDHPGHRNHGMSASRNLGSAHGTGDHIAFLDADDVWEPTKLAEQVALLEAMPDAALVCGALLYWNSWNPAAQEPDRLVLTGGVSDARLETPEALLRFYPLGQAAGAGLDVLVRRTAFDAVGGFEERFRGLYEDQAFLAKIFLRYPVFVSSRPWLRYRQHDASCCAVTTRSDTDYRRLRGAYLDWLAEHVRISGLHAAVLNAAIRKARARLRRTAFKGLLRQTARRLLGRSGH